MLTARFVREFDTSAAIDDSPPGRLEPGRFGSPDDENRFGNLEISARAAIGVHF
jgi:hypothetical protein